eukprot:gene16642-biopygen13156
MRDSLRRGTALGPSVLFGGSWQADSETSASPRAFPIPTNVSRPGISRTGRQWGLRPSVRLLPAHRLRWLCTDAPLDRSLAQTTEALEDRRRPRHPLHRPLQAREIRLRSRRLGEEDPRPPGRPAPAAAPAPRAPAPLRKTVPFGMATPPHSNVSAAAGLMAIWRSRLMARGASAELQQLLQLPFPRAASAGHRVPPAAEGQNVFPRHRPEPLPPRQAPQGAAPRGAPHLRVDRGGGGRGGGAAAPRARLHGGDLLHRDDGCEGESRVPGGDGGADVADGVDPP